MLLIHHLEQSTLFVHFGVSNRGETHEWWHMPVQIRSQTLHILNIDQAGRLSLLHKLGMYCRDDDELVLEQYHLAERIWQEQEQVSWLLSQAWCQSRLPPIKALLNKHGALTLTLSGVEPRRSYVDPTGENHAPEEYAFRLLRTMARHVLVIVQLAPHMYHELSSMEGCLPSNATAQ